MISVESLPMNGELLYLDDDLALGAPGFDMSDSLVRLGKGVDAVDDRADRTIVDQRRDLSQLPAICLHEQEVEAHLALSCFLVGRPAERPEYRLQIPRSLHFGCEGRGHRAGN